MFLASFRWCHWNCDVLFENRLRYNEKIYTDLLKMEIIKWGEGLGLFTETDKRIKDTSGSQYHVKGVSFWRRLSHSTVDKLEGWILLFWRVWPFEKRKVLIPQFSHANLMRALPDVRVYNRFHSLLDWKSEEPKSQWWETRHVIHVSTWDCSSYKDPNIHLAKHPSLSQIYEDAYYIFIVICDWQHQRRLYTKTSSWYDTTNKKRPK